MKMNRIQFQSGLSLPAFLAQIGSEAQCEAALEISRWLQGLRCSECDASEHYLLKGSHRKSFQCHACRLKTSVIAGTLFQSTHLKLTIGFLAIYPINQAKTGLSALALKRQMGVSYPAAWLIQHKLMQVMIEREANCTLPGDGQADDAYLSGELASSTAERGSENRVPFVAAVSLSAEGHTVSIKMAPVHGFFRWANADWASHDLSPDCVVTSDGLACFTGVADIGCQQHASTKRMECKQ